VVVEPEEGFEPSTFRLRVETHAGRFSLLMSAGPSILCAPDLSPYGRRNDRQNDQADSRKAHRPMATFRSRSGGVSSAGNHREIRRLTIDQGSFRHKIGWQGKRLPGARGLHPGDGLSTEEPSGP
jgi:hypothetical protein